MSKLLNINKLRLTKMIKKQSHTLRFGLNGLAACGADIQKLLERHNIDEDSLCIRSTPISTKQWCEILDDAVRQTGDPDIGLKANLNMDFADYGTIGYAALSSPTLQESLKTLMKYIDIHQSGFTTSLSVENGECVLTGKILDSHISVNRAHTDWVGSFVVSFIRNWCGPQWSPKYIHCMYAQPTSTNAHEALFKCPIYFSKESDRIVFDSRYLSTENTQSDPRLLSLLTEELDAVLEQSLLENQEQLEIISETQRKIALTLKNGPPALKDIAPQVNMSTRTLQRRLSDEGYTFKKLVEKTRCDLAQSYIRNSQLSFTDIAFLLGYSELSAFSRAFRRWTRKTPLQYRKSMD